MVWYSPEEETVNALLAGRKYAKAVEVLLAQFKGGSRDPRLRLQLSDVLVLAGKGRQAVPILQGLADEYATEGFAAKAIAVLKKIQKIQPGRVDVEGKLAALIEKKRRETPSTESLRTQEIPAQIPEFGIEEIGMEAEESNEPSDQLIEVVQSTIEAAGREPRPARTREPAISPLFSDFSQEELVAVMRGLELQTFQPGDIIVTAGEPGDSLFVLASGVASAWVKDEKGHHSKVREMAEGAFFGEISILTGQPRTATVTAVSVCELLELHRPALDSIGKTHPRVWDVLREFHRRRTR
jgi:hypothetical protein